MNLNQAINEYRQLSVSQAMAEAVGGVALRTATNQKENFFQRVNDSINNFMEQDADDVFSATLLFSEMSLREIGQVPPYLAYYYGTFKILQMCPRMAKSQLSACAFLRCSSILKRLIDSLTLPIRPL